MIHRKIINMKWPSESLIIIICMLKCQKYKLDKMFKVVHEKTNLSVSNVYFSIIVNGPFSHATNLHILTAKRKQGSIPQNYMLILCKKEENCGL